MCLKIHDDISYKQFHPPPFSGDRVWIQNENQEQQYKHEIKTQQQSFKKDNPAITGSMKIIQTQRQLTNDTKDFMMEIKINF